jgi:hypothetical protein
MENLKYLCAKYEIQNYRINDDGSLDVNGDVFIWKTLGDLKQLPLIFNEVNGDFDCGTNNLTTLQGCPKKVSHFTCSDNDLTSFQHSPKIVEGNFYSWTTHRITSLEGLENTYIGGDLFLGNCNNLYSLKGYPKQVTHFNCSETPLQIIYDTFIQDPDPETISRFNRLKVIDTDGAYWWVYYDQLNKFLRSSDKENLIMSEKDFDSFIKITDYRWDY